jgi:hypothetical protein
VADSLVKIYQEGNLDNAEKLNCLEFVFNEVNNLRLSLKYAEELIHFQNRKKLFISASRLFSKRNKLRLLELDESLDAFFKSEAVSIKSKIHHRQGSDILQCGCILQDKTKCPTILRKAIKLLRKQTIQLV